MIKILSNFLLLYMIHIINAYNYTNRIDNSTVEWVDFNIINCFQPELLDVSSFTCLPDTSYIYIDELSCIENMTTDFDENQCQLQYTYTTSETTGTSFETSESSMFANTHTVQTTPMQNTTQMSTTVATNYNSTTTNVTTLTTTKTVTITTTATRITTSSVTTITSTISTTITSSSSSYAENVSNTTTQYISTSSTASITTSLTTSRTTTSVSGTTSSYFDNNSTTSSVRTTTSMTTSTRQPYYCPSDSYIGLYCNVSSNACDMSRPCYNGGICHPNRTLQYGYWCECPMSFSGYNCEIDNRACKENTCWHNGTCVSANATFIANSGYNFTCECVKGYEGVHCEFAIDSCANIKCENKGVCFQYQLKWKCLCLDSTLYYGDYCQYKTEKLRIRQILSTSFASVAIGVIVTTCSFIIIMDILKYGFRIDPVFYERESYRERLKQRKIMRQQIKDDQPKVAIRFQYVS